MSDDKEALEFFNKGKDALKKKDFDNAVRNFFKATKAGFGDKKYHNAFADALLKRGLTQLKKEDEAKAEELYKRAEKDRTLECQDIWLEALLLGHLDSAYALCKRYVCAVSTTPEGNALHELLLKVNYPPALCREAEKYLWIKGGSQRKKTMEFLQRAADLGYEPAAQRIKNIIEGEKRDKERVTAQKEFEEKNPPLAGEEKKKYEDELKEMLRALSRKAAIFKPEKCKTPLPMKQMLATHIGGVPYFEEGAAWPLNEEGEPYSFVLQIFKDNENAAFFPDGIKLIQIFIDFNEEEHRLVVYRELNTEKAALIDCPVEENLGYMALSFNYIDMLPDYYYLSIASAEVIALAEKIHPGKSEFVINRLLKTLGFKEHDEDSYLGGFYGDLSNSSCSREERKIKSLFQLYLDSDGEGPYGWGRWDDAMIYASFNEKTKEIDSELVINYD